MKSFNLVKKYLLESIFEIDGFKYKFLDVQLKSEKEYSLNYLKLVVNVTLPNKEQSYVQGKFDYDIQRIVESISQHVGPIHISIETFVDGEPTKEIYISQPQKRKILEKLQEIFKGEGDLGFDYEDKKLTSRLKPEFYPDSKNFYKDNGGDITLSFSLNLYDFKIDGKSVKCVPKYLNNLGSTLNDKFIDNDELRNRLESETMAVFEPEFFIGDTSMFYSVQYWCGTLDGKEWSPAGVLTSQGIFNLAFY